MPHPSHYIRVAVIPFSVLWNLNLERRFHLGSKPTNAHWCKRRVQKKTELFNSAPTSTDGALRLLGAHSSRFWQQTAICPVSLWTLVVELHPMNWAHVQTFRRNSDKVTMKELEEQCVCVCVWNFATNSVILLQRHFNCLTKHTGRDGKGSPPLKKHGWVGQKSRWFWLWFLIGKALSIMDFYYVVRW